jgi:hypothetical protein
MSAFDTKVRVGHAGIQLSQTEESELAQEAELVLGVVTFIQTGPDQMLPIPIGTLRIPMDKHFVDGLIDQLQQAAEQMKEPSKIEIASDLSRAEQVADIQSKLR